MKRSTKILGLLGILIPLGFIGLLGSNVPKQEFNTKITKQLDQIRQEKAKLLTSATRRDYLNQAFSGIDTLGVKKQLENKYLTMVPDDRKYHVLKTLETGLRSQYQEFPLCSLCWETFTGPATVLAFTSVMWGVGYWAGKPSKPKIK